MQRQLKCFFITNVYIFGEFFCTLHNVNIPLKYLVLYVLNTNETIYNCGSVFRLRDEPRQNPLMHRIYTLSLEKTPG